MDTQAMVAAIKENVSRVMVGKEEAIDLLLTALICRGHVLIEDVPGIGKTTLVSALARSLGCSFGRVQFTPDVMPSDVTGFTMANLKTGAFEYCQGAIMKQIVLADEINRTSPKTQSALLEAMQEGQVTVDGQTHPLPRPFIVLATQNPVEYVGTYPLPEAQLDRFFMRLSMGYPSTREEIEIMDRFEGQSPLSDLPAVASVEEVLALQQAVVDITCGQAVKEYIALIIDATRKHEDVVLGVSPRGSIALMQAAKGWALLQGRDYALPDDVQRMVEPVLAHRLTLKPEARLKDMTAPRILKNILNLVRVPDAL
jgi:MoxR-like ATPase